MTLPTVAGYDLVETAVGWIGLGYSERGLCCLRFPLPIREQALGEIRGLAPDARPSGSGDLPAQLRAYFGGDQVVFTVPLDLSGGTPFQHQVWELLETIPYGEVRSYAWLATALGRPGAARAVGAAVGANPVPVVVPCHRVIGSDGGLCGYAGGLALKRRLLEIEAGLRAFSQKAAGRSRGQTLS